MSIVRYEIVCKKLIQKNYKNQMDGSPIKIFISGGNKKTRRYSGLIDRTPDFYGVGSKNTNVEQEVTSSNDQVKDRPSHRRSLQFIKKYKTTSKLNNAMEEKSSSNKSLLEEKFCSSKYNSSQGQIKDDDRITTRRRSRQKGAKEDDSINSLAVEEFCVTKTEFLKNKLGYDKITVKRRSGRNFDNKIVIAKDDDSHNERRCPTYRSKNCRNLFSCTSSTYGNGEHNSKSENVLQHDINSTLILGDTTVCSNRKLNSDAPSLPQKVLNTRNGVTDNNRTKINRRRTVSTFSENCIKNVNPNETNKNVNLEKVNISIDTNFEAVCPAKINITHHLTKPEYVEDDRTPKRHTMKTKMDTPQIKRSLFVEIKEDHEEGERSPYSVMELDVDMASLDINNEKKRRLSNSSEDSPVKHNRDEHNTFEEMEDCTVMQPRRSGRKKVRTSEYIKPRVLSKPKKLTDKSNLSEIHAYYLDKRVKRFPPSLETIFEEPQDIKNEVSFMSSRRFRRCINFTDLNRMNQLKTKKRRMKAKKHNSNKRLTNKLTMEILMQQLAKIDCAENGK